MTSSPVVTTTARPRDGPVREPLKLGRGNAKLHDGVFTFSLPAGFSCPFARACLSKSDPATGRLRDGRHTSVRCYAASMEARRPSVRRARWHNLELLKACRSRDQMTRLLLDSISPFVRLLRVHDSGDFWSQAYFDAWVVFATERPDTLLYAYTKALPWWVARLDQVGDGRQPGPVPNLVLTASWGGTHDHLIGQYGLRSARIVFSADEAAALGLPLDHDDAHAMAFGPDFGLLVHGAQPRGSAAAAALSALRKAGWSGYGKVRVALPVVGGTDP